MAPPTSTVSGVRSPPTRRRAEQHPARDQGRCAAGEFQREGERDRGLQRRRQGEDPRVGGAPGRRCGPGAPDRREPWTSATRHLETRLGDPEVVPAAHQHLAALIRCIRLTPAPKPRTPTPLRSSPIRAVFFWPPALRAGSRGASRTNADFRLCWGCETPGSARAVNPRGRAGRTLSETPPVPSPACPVAGHG